MAPGARALLLAVTALMTVCAGGRIASSRQSCGGGAQETRRKGKNTLPGGLTAVWANDGGDKVTRHELRATKAPKSVLNSVWDGGSIRLFGARNETVAFNVVLEAAHGAKGIRVAFRTLRHASGSSIATGSSDRQSLYEWRQRHVELFRVGYLQIRGLSHVSYDHYDERHIPTRLRRPFSGDGRGRGTWGDRPDADAFYPEIAIPLEADPAIDIQVRSNQSVWVDIYIPKSAAAGRHTGCLTISDADANRLRVPVILDVRDFTLPDTNHAATMVYFSQPNIARRYFGAAYPDDVQVRRAVETVVDRHFLLAHRHRIALIGDADAGVSNPSPPWEARLDGSLFTAKQGYDGPGVGVPNDIYAIGTYGSWQWRKDDENAMRQYSSRWVRWFEQNAPGTTYFLYLIDESSDYEQIERWAAWIRKGPGPGRRLMSMATLAAPVAVARTPSLSIATSTLSVGRESQWESAVGVYKRDPHRRIFLYNGHRPASGSFAIEDDGVAMREIPWGQYKKRIDRWFYWESTYYDNYQGGAGETDVFRKAHTFGSRDRVDPVLGVTGWNYGNGDGVLFYPGTDRVFPESSYGIDGPFASLRLKHWRRGIQDVAYLELARRVDPKRVGRIIARMVPKVLWEHGVARADDPTWVRCDISWPTDPDVWEGARRELADVIERGAGRRSEEGARPKRRRRVGARGRRMGKP